MLEEDAVRLCGSRYGRAAGKEGHRWGKTRGKVGFHGGKVEINDDGELVYTKSGLQTEVLKLAQAIERWPAAEQQIREALERLD